MDIYVIIFITLIAALITSFSQILFKVGIRKKLNSIMDVLGLLRIRLVLLGVLGYVASLAMYLYALSGSQLSVVYPTFASTFIFVALFSSMFLKERIGTLRAIGIAVIFLGIFLVGITI